MNKNSQLIVISTPRFFQGEVPAVIGLMEAGLSLFHLRKPEGAEKEFRDFLRAVPQQFHCRIVLHDAFHLAREYGLKGIHLNRRNPSIPAGFEGSVSRSCHSLQEVAESGQCDYVFLSPVFDSISKEGYGSGFSPAVLEKAAKQGVITSRVIALGGISAGTIPLIKPYGFGGIALLGALWSDYALHPDREALIRRFNLLNDLLSK